MADSSDARVAVYIDFDNIVISRYARVQGQDGATYSISVERIG